jgi:hypothetical protein
MYSTAASPFIQLDQELLHNLLVICNPVTPRTCWNCLYTKAQLDHISDAMLIAGDAVEQQY